MQVKDDLYAFKNQDTAQPIFKKIANLSSNCGSLEILDRAVPPIARSMSNLVVNSANTFMLVSGGYNPLNFQEVYDSVDRYDIGDDVWKG